MRNTVRGLFAFRRAKLGVAASGSEGFQAMAAVFLVAQLNSLLASGHCRVICAALRAVARPGIAGLERVAAYSAGALVAQFLGVKHAVFVFNSRVRFVVLNVTAFGLAEFSATVIRNSL